MKSRKLKKYFPELYGWIEKLVYPKKLRSYIKIDYIHINTKNIIDGKRESHCQVELFSMNNNYIFNVKKPCTNYPNGWINLYQQILIEKKKRNIISNLMLIDGDYIKY